jgi:hypothetical protein
VKGSSKPMPVAAGYLPVARERALTGGYCFFFYDKSHHSPHKILPGFTALLCCAFDFLKTKGKPHDNPFF